MVIRPISDTWVSGEKENENQNRGCETRSGGWLGDRRGLQVKKAAKEELKASSSLPMRDESPLEALFRAPESRFYLEGAPAFVLACRNARKYAASDMTTWRKVRLPALAPGIVGPGNTARQHPVQSPDKVVTSSTRSLYPRSRRYVLLPNYGNRVDELPSGDSSQSAAPSSPGRCPCSLSCQWEWA